MSDELGHWTDPRDARIEELIAERDAAIARVEACDVLMQKASDRAAALLARALRAEADAIRLQSLYDRSHEWQTHDAMLDALRLAAEALAGLIDRGNLAVQWVGDPPDRSGEAIDRASAALAAVRKVRGGAP